MQKSQECVDHIFKKDDSLGTVRNHTSEEISLSETIKRYTAALNHLDFSNCPDEFSAAFNEHIVAWNQMKDVTDRYSDLRGEMHDLFDVIDKSKDSSEFRAHLKAIWDTWEPIEKARNTQ
ncbi:MAG: hypothetical protein HKN90_02430 [Flavobacteriaceae bacterium]|nr:hypothetical protein [Flavobacteriaceae bacterium]